MVPPVSTLRRGVGRQCPARAVIDAGLPPCSHLNRAQCSRTSSQISWFMRFCLLISLTELTASAVGFVPALVPRTFAPPDQAACRNVRKHHMLGGVSMKAAEEVPLKLAWQRTAEPKAQDSGMVLWTDYLELASARTVSSHAIHQATRASSTMCHRCRESPRLTPCGMCATGF
eukprot:3695623-Rhodomonas_salina.2